MPAQVRYRPKLAGPGRFSMSRIQLERAALSVLALLPACALLPGDHGARTATEGVARSLRGMTARAHTAWADTTRRVAVLGRTVQALPGQATGAATTLVHEVSTGASELPDRVARGVGRLTASFDGTRDRAETDLLRVVRSTDLLSGLNAGARAMRGALDRAAAVSRLDRRPMAETTDPERATSLEAGSRTRTWLERVLRRLGLTD